MESFSDINSQQEINFNLQPTLIKILPKKINLTSEVEIITPEMAVEYLKYNISNRNMTKSVVKDYCTQILNGQWKLNGEPIIFLENGTLSNGQHRLQAIVETHTSMEILVVRGADNDSMSTYDSGKIRTISDVFNLHKIPNCAAVSSIVNKYLQISKAGGFGTNGGFDRKRFNVTKQDILNEYFNNESIFRQAFSISTRKKLNILENSLIGGIIVFLNKNKKYDMKIIDNFFFQLLDEKYGQCTNSTINLLRVKLINDTGKIKKMTYNHKFNLIVKTWNCFILNKQLKTLNVSDVEEFV